MNFERLLRDWRILNPQGLIPGVEEILPSPLRGAPDDEATVHGVEVADFSRALSFLCAQAARIS